MLRIHQVKAVSPKNAEKLTTVAVLPVQSVLSLLLDSLAAKVEEKLTTSKFLIPYSGELDSMLLPIVLENMSKALSGKSNGDTGLAMAAGFSISGEYLLLHSTKEMSRMISTDIVTSTYLYNAFLSTSGMSAADKQNQQDVIRDPSAKAEEKLNIQKALQASVWHTLAGLLGQEVDGIAGALEASDTQSIYKALISNARRGKGVALKWAARKERIEIVNLMRRFTHMCQYENSNTMTTDELVYMYSALASLDIYLDEIEQYETKWVADLYQPNAAAMVSAVYLSARSYAEVALNMAMQAPLLRLAVARISYEEDTSTLQTFLPLSEDVVIEKLRIREIQRPLDSLTQPIYEVLKDAMDQFAHANGSQKTTLTDTWLGDSIDKLMSKASTKVTEPSLRDAKYPITFKPLGVLSKEVEAELVPAIRWKANVSLAAEAAYSRLQELISAVDLGESLLVVKPVTIPKVTTEFISSKWGYSAPTKQSPFFPRVPRFTLPSASDPQNTSLDRKWVFDEDVFKTQIGDGSFREEVATEPSYYWAAAHPEVYPLIQDFVVQPIPYPYVAEYTRMMTSNDLISWWEIVRKTVPFSTPEDYFRSAASLMDAMDEDERGYFASQMASTFLVGKLKDKGKSFHPTGSFAGKTSQLAIVTPSVDGIWGAPVKQYIKENTTAFDAMTEGERKHLAYVAEAANPIYEIGSKSEQWVFILITRVPPLMPIGYELTPNLKNIVSLSSYRSDADTPKQLKGAIDKISRLDLGSPNVVGIAHASVGLKDIQANWLDVKGLALTAIPLPHLTVRSNSAPDLEAIFKWDVSQYGSLAIVNQAPQNMASLIFMVEADIWAWDYNDWKESATLDCEIKPVSVHSEFLSVKKGTTSDNAIPATTPEITEAPIESEARAEKQITSIADAEKKGALDALKGDPSSETRPDTAQQPADKAPEKEEWLTEQSGPLDEIGMKDKAFKGKLSECPGARKLTPEEISFLGL